MGQESLAPKETRCKTQNSRKTRQKQPERPCPGKQLTAGVGEASQHPRPPSRCFLSKKSSKSKNPAKLRRPEKLPAPGKTADGGPGAAETSDEANRPDTTTQNRKQREDLRKANSGDAEPAGKETGANDSAPAAPGDPRPRESQANLR